MTKETLIRSKADENLSLWREKEKKAVELLAIAGELRFDKSIELVIFRRAVYDSRPSEILNFLPFAKNFISNEITIETCLSIVKAIASLTTMVPAKIDIGKLAIQYHEDGGTTSLDDFVGNKLSAFVDVDRMNEDAKDVVLYGFGRIGRLVARRIINSTGKGEQLRLKAVVIRSKMKDRMEELEKRAALLRTDSVHGDFRGLVKVAEDGTGLIINGNRVHFIFAGAPSDIDYREYGIDNALIIDNTGVWRDKEALSGHLRPGASEVMLTAPGKGIPNIVYGVNNHDLDLENDKVLCAASCTTNAIVPILKTMDDNFKILKGHIETIHAYTSDQNLLDNFHKKPRRGRGAAINMVLTTTGAAKAVSLVLPHLKGKLTGNAVRVPTPNVSLVIMNLSLENGTSVEAINKLMRKVSLEGPLVEQIHYSSSTEYVSSDAVGMTSTSVFDAPSTIVSEDGKSVTIYAWYDNEFGYTCQVIRLAKYLARVRRFNYY